MVINMKRTMNRLVAGLAMTLVVAVVAISQIPATAVVAETTAIADFQVNEGTLVKYQGTASTITIPKNVERIGEEAFAGNTTLISVSIPSTVEEIAYGAFANCTSLKRVSIADGTKEIGNGVFAGCSNLTKVTFGKDVKTVGSGIFVGCNKLEKIDISSKNEYLVYESGVLYDKEKTTLIEMLPARENKAFKCPSTVTSIRPYAFWGVQNLKKVLLSQSLHEIPAYAFGNCQSLTGIEIPYSVYSIEMKAFENCTGLEEAIIHPSVNYIDDTAFEKCYNLEITAEEDSYAYEFAQSHPIEEETISKYAQNTENNNEGTTLESDENTGEDSTNNGSQNGGSSGSGYVDPLEYPETPGSLGKTRVVGNNAFVIIEGTKPTVH